MMIEQAIKASETAHVGEIRFAVEGALDGVSLFKGQSARARAIAFFSTARVGLATQQWLADLCAAR